MAQLTSESEVLINSIIYLECKIEALIKILQEGGIPISTEQIESEMHRIHATQGNVKKHIMMCRMNDSRFDFK